MTRPETSTIHHWIRRLRDFGGDAYPFPGLPLIGEKTRLRIFRREDEGTRQRWGKFQEPYLTKYNFVSRGTHENDLTFQRLKDRIRLAVENTSGQMIGYVALKPTTEDASAAELGICFSADHVYKGYGTEVMRLVLPWAVDVLGIERIVLDVDAINTCAIRLYQRFRFRKVTEYWYKETNPELKAYLGRRGSLDGVRCLHNRLEILSWKMDWRAIQLADG